jgi:MFS family permease
MKLTIVLPAVTSLLAFAFALALLDQWRERRRPYQLVWTIGMVFFGIASGCEAIGGASGWNDLLSRTWYLTGAAWTAGWLGLGTAFLLGRTRFGYTFAACLFLAGLFTFLTQQKEHYPDVGSVPLLYFLAGGVVALAVAIETYFANERWPAIAAVAVVGATVLSLILMITATVPAPGYELDPATGAPTGAPFPGVLRLLTPFLNVTGAFALGLGALFSAYVFMPKRRVLGYSLDPNQSGDQFLFNLAISPVAIVVNFVASLPGAVRAILTGQIHSRVPATLLIAAGAFVAAGGDSLNRFGITSPFQWAKFLAVLLIFTGFLLSIEVFREIRIPFTGIRLATARHERVRLTPEMAAAGATGFGDARRERGDDGDASNQGAGGPTGG